MSRQQQQALLPPWRGILDAMGLCQRISRAEGCTPQHMQTLLDSVETFILQSQNNPYKLPMSVLQTLVRDMKVPATVTEVCCSLLDKFEGIGCTLVDVLATFLSEAAASGALALRGDPYSFTDVQPSALASAIGQQLQQAGLLQHLGPILAHITEQLGSARPSVSVLRELAQDDKRPGGGPTRGSDAKQQTLTALQYAQQATTLYSHLQTLWPVAGAQAQGGCTPAHDATFMALVVRTVQQISGWLEQLPEGWRDEPYACFASIMVEALEAVTRCAMLRVSDPDTLARVGPNRTPRYAPLLLSAAYHQALCIGLFYNMHATLISEDPPAAPAPAAAAAAPSSSAGSVHSTRGTSSSSSSSKKKKKAQQKRSTAGSSSSSTRQRPAGAASLPASRWVLACQLEQEAVSFCQHLLLQELACSGKALLWAALSAAAAGELKVPADSAACLEMAYSQVVENEGHLQVSGLAVLRQPEEQHAAEALHQLLPVMLLQCARALPRLDSQGVVCCGVAAQGARWALQGVMQIKYPRGVGAALAQAVWGADGQARHLEAPFTYVEDLLPPLKGLLSQLLEQAWGGDSSSSSSSSSRSGGGSGQQHSRAGAEEADAVHDTMTRLLAVVLVLAETRVQGGAPAAFAWREAPGDSAAAASSAGAAQEGGSNSSSSSPPESQPHPWQPHAAQFAALVESYVRLSCSSARVAGHRYLSFAIPAGLCSVGERPAPGCLAATAAAAGFGSQEQLRLFSLLCTLVKLARSLGPAQQSNAEECRLAAATAAAAFAKLFAAQAAAGDPPPAAALLPWLVLLGRCCVQWAVQLQWWLRGIEGLPPAGAVPQEDADPGSVLARFGVNNTRDLFLARGPEPPHTPLACELLTAVAAPLQDGSSELAGHLRQAGIDAGTLHQQLLSTAEAAAAAAAAVSSGADRQQQEAALIQQVKELGLALTSLPISSVCSNPYCSPALTAEASELDLVKGSGKVCSACKAVHYCSTACQSKHWKQHKPVCKAIAATAAAAAAAGSASGAAAAPVQ